MASLSRCLSSPTSPASAAASSSPTWEIVCASCPATPGAMHWSGRSSPSRAQYDVAHTSASVPSAFQS